MEKKIFISHSSLDTEIGEMWLAKVARRGENLVQYLKISP